jgi:hypothetical protein
VARSAVDALGQHRRHSASTPTAGRSSRAARPAAAMRPTTSPGGKHSKSGSDTSTASTLSPPVRRNGSCTSRAAATTSVCAASRSTRCSPPSWARSATSNSSSGSARQRTGSRTHRVQAPRVLLEADGRGTRTTRPCARGTRRPVPRHGRPGGQQSTRIEQAPTADPTGRPPNPARVPRAGFFMPTHPARRPEATLPSPPTHPSGPLRPLETADRRLSHPNLPTTSTRTCDQASELERGLEPLTCRLRGGCSAV